MILCYLQKLKKYFAENRKGNGVYAFVLSGDFEVNGQKLETRDGFGMWDLDNFNVKALTQDAEILLMEVPMR